MIEFIYNKITDVSRYDFEILCGTYYLADKYNIDELKQETLRSIRCKRKDISAGNAIEVVHRRVPRGPLPPLQCSQVKIPSGPFPLPERYPWGPFPSQKDTLGALSPPRKIPVGPFPQVSLMFFPLIFFFSAMLILNVIRKRAGLSN